MLPYREHRSLYFLLIFSLLLRGLAAAFLEVGNDEVYYWTYAAFPALSHFDHPPMVGYVIQLFTLNLSLDHEFFLRLASVIFGTVNTYLIYLIALRFINERAALFSALLYTASIYCSIISGIFIMPDTPLLPLWLGSMYLIARVISAEEISRKNRHSLLYAGLLIGLAVLSKYHAVFLWGGFGLYILFYDRRWLKVKETYLAMLLTLLCLLPIGWWNWQHDFISFRFQGERVSIFEQGWRPDRFLTELFGQLFYNNPFNVALIIMAMVALRKGKEFISKPLQRFFLLTALPLIGLILFFSMFRKTLPHWSGPAYLTLIPIAAAYVAQHMGKLPLRLISASVGLLFFLVVAGTVEINGGFLTAVFTPKATQLIKQGKHDVTLDMYGWKRFARTFQALSESDVEGGMMPADAPIIAHRWFNAAHLDYYVARPLDKKLLAFGDLKDIHKYAWINRTRGLPQLHSSAYYITNSRAFTGPEVVQPYFERMVSCDTIPVYRMGRIAEYFFVYRLNDYQGNFTNPLPD